MKKPDIKKFILLTGIPGAGKTHLGTCLRKEKDFNFFETDPYIDNFGNLNTDNWDEFRREVVMGVGDFVDRWHKKYGDLVCIEWGFDPFVPSFFQELLSFKKQGAILLWLTCDRPTARSNYLKKNSGKDPAGGLWDIQVGKIDYVGLPTSDFVIIQTHSYGNPIPDKDLIRKIPNL